jgi:hypothetical protein
LKFLNLDIAEKILAKVANYKKIHHPGAQTPAIATKFQSSVPVDELTTPQFLMLVSNAFTNWLVKPGHIRKLYPGKNRNEPFIMGPRGYRNSQRITCRYHQQVHPAFGGAQTA